jgi:hypothetical protein
MARAKAGDRPVSERAKSKGDGAAGAWITLLFLCFVGWCSFQGRTGAHDTTRPAATVAPDAAALTLGGYANLSRSDRRDVLFTAVAKLDIPSDGELGTYAHLDVYTRCMGTMAFDKDPGVAFLDALGWCDTQRRTSPDIFAAHIDEIEVESVVGMAAEALCQELVEARLVSPASADFPWLADRRVRRLRHRYIVQSHVDSQNLLGAVLRTHYTCEVQMSGGDWADPDNWKVIKLDLQPG